MALTDKTFDKLFDQAVARNNVINRYSKAITGQPMATPRSNTTPFVPTAQTAQPVSKNDDLFDTLYKRAERNYTLSKAKAGTKNVENNLPGVQTVPQQTFEINNEPISVDNSLLKNSSLNDAEIRELEHQGYVGGAEEVANSTPMQMLGIAGLKKYGGILAAAEGVGQYIQGGDKSAAWQNIMDETVYNQNADAGQNLKELYDRYYTASNDWQYGGGLGATLTTERRKAQQELTKGKSALQQVGINGGIALLELLSPGGIGAYAVSSGGQKMVSSAEKGMSGTQAVARGGLDTAITLLTMKMGAAQLPGIFNTLLSKPGEKILRSTGTMALRSALRYLGDYAADVAVKDPNAQFSIADLVKDALSGAALGAAFGTVQTVGDYINVKNMSPEMQEFYKWLNYTDEGAERKQKFRDAYKEWKRNGYEQLFRDLFVGEQYNGPWSADSTTVESWETPEYALPNISIEGANTPQLAPGIYALPEGEIAPTAPDIPTTPATVRPQSLADILPQNLGEELIRPTRLTVPNSTPLAVQQGIANNIPAQLPQQIAETPAEIAPVQERPVPSETPEKIPSPLETEDAERYIKSLESTGKDNKGYRQYVSTSLERLEDALKIVDSDLYNAYLAEANSGEVSSPIIDTVINMDNVVRGDLVSPMAMARFLSRAYKAEGIEGLRNVYSRLDYTNPKVYQQILDGALPSEASNVTQTESTTSQVEKKQAKTPKAKKNPHTKSYNNALAGAKRKVKSGKHDFMSVLRDATNNYYLSVDELSDLYDDLVAYSDKNNLMVGYPRKEDVLKSHKGYQATENVEQSVAETRPIQPETTAPQPGTVSEYKGYGIDYNIYGNGEYSVQVAGDDLLFNTEEEAKAYIDDLTKDRNYVRETSQEEKKRVEERPIAKDSAGRSLTEAQSEFFKDSKARDKDGNLLVLYHGTSNAGFNAFDLSRGRVSGIFMTTSKRDADSYGGNDGKDGGKIYDPNEDRTVIRKLATVKDLVEHPNDFTLKDIDERILTYNNGNAATVAEMKAEGYTKADIIDGIRQAIKEEEEADGESGLAAWTFRTNSKRGKDVVGEDKNRTYEMYANIKNPYVKNYGERLGSFHEDLRTALNSGEYDGFIAEKLPQGRYKDFGQTVVVAFSPDQVKLASNTNPTEGNDITAEKMSEAKTETNSFAALTERARTQPWDTFLGSLNSKDAKVLKANGVDSDTVEKWWREQKDKMWGEYTPHETSVEEAIATVRENVPENLLDGWFRDANSRYKPKIEGIILSNPDVRNAGLNIAYHNYKFGKDNPMSFEEFLNTDMAMYRGFNADSWKKQISDDVFVAFTPDVEEAKKFGKDLVSVSVKPKDTLGSYQTTGEQEYLVPADIAEKAQPFENKPKATPKAEAEKAVATPKNQNRPKLKLKEGEYKQDYSYEEGGLKLTPGSEQYDKVVNGTVGKDIDDAEEVVRVDGGYEERFMVAGDLVFKVSTGYDSKSVPVTEYNAEAKNGMAWDDDMQPSPWDYFGPFEDIPDNAMLVKDKKSGTGYYRVGDSLFSQRSVEALQNISYELRYDSENDAFVGLGRPVDGETEGETIGYVTGTWADEITTQGQTKATGLLSRKNNDFYDLDADQRKHVTPKAQRAKSVATPKSEAAKEPKMETINPERLKELEKEAANERLRKQIEEEGVIAGYSLSDDEVQMFSRAVNKGKSAVQETLDFVNGIFNPTKKRNEAEISAFFRAKGDLEKAYAQFQHVGKPLKKAFDSMPVGEQLAFTNRYQNGIPQPNPTLQAADDYIRSVIEPLRRGLQEINPNFEGIDNYMKQMWKEQGKRYEDASALMRKRGLVGDKSFLKQRVYDTYVEGINAGLHPLTTNPIEIAEYTLASELRYIVAHRLFNELKDMGSIKFVAQTARTPDGWTEIDDSLFKVYYPTEIKKLGQIGRYVARKGVGQILHNWLMPNDIRNSALGSSLSDAKNFFVRTELALSGFHYVQTYMTAMSESVNIGLQNLVNLKNFGEARRIVDPVFTTRNTRKAGRKLMALALDEKGFMSNPENVKWLKEHPLAKVIIDLWWKGGGKLSQNEYEDMGRRLNRSFKEILRDFTDMRHPTDPLRIVYNLAWKASEQITKPLFEKIIPSLKMGFFMLQMEHDMQVYRDDLASGKLTLEQLARKAIDAMDDLFGAMNYDNRNWNRNVRQGLQFAFRSPTWWYGNLDMYYNIGKEGVDLTKAVISKDRKAILGKHMGFGLSMLYVSAVVGTMIYFLYNGTMPEDWKDMFAPWTGEYDKNGEKVRLSAPGYIKSWFNLATDPGKSATSATSGFADFIYRVARNKDYYGNYIVDKSSPLYEWPGQVLDYFAKELMIPFSISNVIEDYDKAKTPEGDVDWGAFTKMLIPDMAGMSKAPKLITTSKFKRDVEKAYEKSNDYKPPAGSPKDADTREAKAELRQRIFDGTATDEEVQKAIEDGIISLDSAKNAKMYTYVYQWSWLDKADRTRLWDEASDEEKQNLAVVELKKSPDKQNNSFVAEWKSGEFQVPGQDEFSRLKVYRTATFDETRAALQFYYQYMRNKDTARYTDKDMADLYNSTNRLVKGGYSVYESVMFREVLKGVESNKNEKGNTIPKSRHNNRVNLLIRKGYSRKEAEAIVNLYEGK